MKPSEYWQRHDHRIQRCDATTGHTVRDVAFCDSRETADRIFLALEWEADDSSELRKIYDALGIAGNESALNEIERLRTIAATSR